MRNRFYLGGGIGSGKSTAAAWFTLHGASLISGDDAGREVLSPGTPEARQVSQRWPEVVDSAGAIDRRALGRLVFADAELLRELEEITGPRIREIVRERAAADTAPVVMVELPVLRDIAGLDWEWIVVDAPDELRMRRTVARGGGMSAEEVGQVMLRQPTRGEWLAAAAWVIDNSGDEAQLAEECRRVWAEICPD